jgi:alpha-galactosidase
MSLGLDFGNCLRVALWRLGGEDTCVLPLPKYAGQDLAIRIGFPETDKACSFRWDKAAGTLTVTLPNANMARILEINL